MVVARDCEKGGSGELAFNGHRISAGEDEKALERDGWWWLYGNENILDFTELYT